MNEKEFTIFYSALTAESQRRMKLAGEKGKFSAYWETILIWYAGVVNMPTDETLIQNKTTQMIFPMLDEFELGKNISKIEISRSNANPIEVTRKLPHVSHDKQTSVNMSQIVLTIRSACEAVGIDVENFVPPINPVERFMSY